MKDNLVFIVQARAGGFRFPGKMLAPLLGQPLLLWHLSRLSRVEIPHTLVVACPDTPGNEAIADLCKKHGYLCELVPVPENDVLARYAWVAQKYDATEIVRTCADCPCLDPCIVFDLIVSHWHPKERSDHTGIAACWPDGQDCEIFSRQALDMANAEATSISDREHVTPWIWSQPDRFRLATLPCPFDLSAAQWSTSVDTSEDLRLVEHFVMYTLPRIGMTFGWRDLWATLRLEPWLADRMAARQPRNQAYVEQVAKEQGIAVQNWERIRYGGVEV